MLKCLTAISVILLASGLLCRAAEANPLAVATMQKPEAKALAPLPLTEKAASSHSPFETDKNDCSVCHKNKDPKDPGPLLTTNVTSMCLDCHDDFKKVMSRKFQHKPMEAGCTFCHNPHESKNRKLLVENSEQLCLSCHEPIKKLATTCKVKHDAMTTDAKCLNCHNPHSADVEHLLVQLPFDLCVKCHSTNNLADHDGKKLTNFKALLDANKEWHGPVSSKDCDSCHNPHGSDHFRILSSDYPPAFYSAYDPKNYANCFECHNEDMLTEPETTSKTQFRNGSQNLHYLHVNKPDRGRTCRACHEVHASPQKHQIRASVPYGSKGWMLQLNFTQTQTGGSCEKTCHSARSYTNKVAKIVVPEKAPAEPAKDSARAEAK